MLLWLVHWNLTCGPLMANVSSSLLVHRSLLRMQSSKVGSSGLLAQRVPAIPRLEPHTSALMLASSMNKVVVTFLLHQKMSSISLQVVGHRMDFAPCDKV